MVSPFAIPPHPSAQAAAKIVIQRVHAYMNAHPESELHRQGKMFGVLVLEPSAFNSQYPDNYIAAFSAQLDGSYYHEGFVPPTCSMNNEQLTMHISPIGHSKEESQRLQRLLFAQYQLMNGYGETKNLLEIFANEKPIVPQEEWFSGRKFRNEKLVFKEILPPSGAGECCAPKLLQYALSHHLKPFALAEFWIGAPSRTEIRQEGCFYAPCSGRCVPILRFMLQGIAIEKTPEDQRAEELCREIEILYEDKDLLIVNKPSGLLSVPGKSNETSVESYLSARAVHRLDQDTSGLLVLAKTPKVYVQLQAFFQRRDILKRYEAVCKGEGVKELKNEGVIELPLLPNPYDRPRQMVNKEHGKPAITRYTMREQRADGTILMDFFPLTGRTHQIRVHAAHPDGLNAPILGDRLYSALPSQISVPRLLLHAAEIRFVHPVTLETMHFCCPSNF